MRAKLTRRFCSQSARLPCQTASYYLERRLYSKSGRDLDSRSLDSNFDSNLINSNLDSSISSKQKGASTLVLALFVVAILVTVVVGLLFGYKLGYQRGFHSIEAETKQAMVESQEAVREFEDLRLSHKVATNQAATAKQELAISLANLTKLREDQQALTIQNKQLSQLNDVYSGTLSEKGGMPLQVLGAKIEPLPENAFEYGFDIGMLSKDNAAKRLVPTLVLLNDDDFVEVPLEPSVYTIEGIVRIRGRFMMPSGFKPLQVKLSLQADGQEVEQLYDWKLGDRVDSMPLSLLDLPDVDENPIEP